MRKAGGLWRVVSSKFERRAAILLLCALVSLLVMAAVRFWPRPPLSAYAPSSTAVFDDKGRLLRLTLASDDQYRLWTPLAEVSPQLVQALLLHEDRHFYWHPGINPAALVRAASATYSGGVRQGGSTITMQLARLIWHLNTRTPRGKLVQMLRALELELEYSKHEILEAHINLLPYGGNIQGAGAASLIYFGKTADRLSLTESLSLTLIPQSPLRRTPAGREPESLRAARQRLFDDWLQDHPESASQRAAVALPLRYRGLAALPFEAPHLTDMLLQNPHAGTASLHSTLNLETQRLLQRRVQQYVARQRRLGINNASAMLIDTRTMAVKALVGSADFFDNAIEGQVNGTAAKRSPGSALKPFIYGLAMDQGLIHPLSVLKDSPTAFGPFSPENFDGRFAGPITAHDALIRSRNIPAVSLASKLASPSLYQFLQNAGVSRMASEQHYGLALALGGGEVTMEELVTLYAALANHGHLRPLRYCADEPASPGAAVLSDEASWLVLNMLSDNPRPDDALLHGSTRLPVAWKTGTSWGFRDAWSVGVFGPYVLAVWVGNFDGSSNPAFVGVQAAAPLFFDIVDAVLAQQPNLSAPLRSTPAGLSRVEVCAASGDLPNADCPQRATTWFIPGKSPIRVSQVHRRIYIDTRSGRQACPPYDPATTRSEVYEFWPSDLARLFAQAGIPRRSPPPTGDCNLGGDVAGVPPNITSPLSGATYTLRSESAASGNVVPLQANADGDARVLYWFVDDGYAGSSAAGVALAWQPNQSGSHTVRVVDDHGRADEREIRVAVVR